MMRDVSAIFSIQFSFCQVDAGGGAGVQYCRLVCQGGAWQGPYCSHNPSHDINFRGEQHMKNMQHINAAHT